MYGGFISIFQRITLHTITVSAICLVAGCSKPEPELIPLTGMVFFNNQPVPRAKLVFHPQFEGPGWMPVAIAETDGSFEVSTRDPGDGALEGKYTVTVEWRPDSEDDEGPNRLPARYADPQTSGLEITVAPDSADLPTFKLTDKP